MLNCEAEKLKGRTTVKFFQSLLNGKGKEEEGKPRLRGAACPLREEAGEAIARTYGLSSEVPGRADGNES